MPLQATSGAASYDGFGGNGVPVVPNYIEEVFSTYLYTGNGSTQTITNGIDLSTNGGLVWLKARTAGVTDSHGLFDTARGVRNALFSDSLSGQIQVGASAGVTNFGATGFTTVNNGSGGSGWNNTSIPYASWTFRKQPKFFDIVTFTTDSTLNQRISHSLNSVPGCIIIKATGASDNWYVYHRTLGRDKYLRLQSTAAVGTIIDGWGTSDPTSTDFGISYNLQSGSTACVAYLFAHNAGGFGLTGTDNVISCGSFSTDSGGKATVNLGYEPQCVMFKRTDSSSFGNWYMIDNMRGFTNPSGSSWLWANTSNAEQTGINFAPESTGFNINFTGPANWVYIAIRRGPMKVPTTGTSVFSPVARTGTSTANTAVTAGFPVDAAFIKASSDIKPWDVEDRLRGGGKYLEFQSTAAEVAGSPVATINFTASNTGVLLGTDSYVNSSANSYANYFLQRAPSFFDEVCYTGTGTAGLTVTHNLGVVPELIIVKGRSYVTDWAAYSATLGNTKYLRPNTDAAEATSSLWWNNTSPTATTFTLGNGSRVNNTSSDTYVAYLFATCAGVSKVGSYTGNGTTQTINCGFGAGGARFVLIKRTDSTGDWYVYDTARGMTVLTDPYLFLNSTAAETATLGSVTTVSTGFAVNASVLAAINTNAASYIFLAIA